MQWNPPWLGTLSATNEQGLSSFSSGAFSPLSHKQGHSASLNPSFQDCASAIIGNPEPQSKGPACLAETCHFQHQAHLYVTMAAPLYLPFHLMNCMDLPHYFSLKDRKWWFYCHTIRLLPLLSLGLLHPPPTSIKGDQFLYTLPLIYITSVKAPRLGL